MTLENTYKVLIGTQIKLFSQNFLFYIVVYFGMVRAEHITFIVDTLYIIIEWLMAFWKRGLMLILIL